LNREIATKQRTIEHLQERLEVLRFSLIAEGGVRYNEDS
jgi:hypothetical protein